MTHILTKLSILKHRLECFIWRRSPHDWCFPSGIKTMMYRLSEDGERWEYREMTPEEADENYEWWATK